MVYIISTLYPNRFLFRFLHSISTCLLFSSFYHVHSHHRHTLSFTLNFSGLPSGLKCRKEHGLKVRTLRDVKLGSSSQFCPEEWTDNKQEKEVPGPKWPSRNPNISPLVSFHLIIVWDRQENEKYNLLLNIMLFLDSFSLPQQQSPAWKLNGNPDPPQHTSKSVLLLLYYCYAFFTQYLWEGGGSALLVEEVQENMY